MIKNLKDSKLKKGAGIGLMSFAALGVIGVSGLGVSAYANSADRQDALSAQLSEKFGLDQEAVSAELESFQAEQKAERQVEMAAKISEQLQTKVDDGTITAAQKTLIEDRIASEFAEREAEMEAKQAEREAGVELTDEEREAKRAEHEAEREANQAEWEAWFSDNGIDLTLEDIRGAGGKGHGGRHGRGGPGGNSQTTETTPTESTSTEAV